MDVRMAHRLQGLYLVVHDAGGAREGTGVADEEAEVDVDGGVLGGPAEGEVAELDGS